MPPPHLLIPALAVLVLVIVLNHHRFSSMGVAQMLRLALIWAVIIVAGILIINVLGLRI